MSEFSRKFVIACGIVLCLASFVAGQAVDQAADALLARLDCPDRVQDVAFSPDGKLLAAGYGWNDQGGARVWNLADRTTVATLVAGKGDSANIERVAFSADGKLFAAANWHGDVMLWTVGSWRSHKTVLFKRGSPKSLSFSPKGTKLAFSSEQVAILYDYGSGKAITLSARATLADSLIAVSFSPDGKTVAVCRNNGIEVRDAASGRLLKSWKADQFGFFGRLSPDGNRLITGGGPIYGEKSVEIWDVRDGRKVSELSEFRSGLFSLAISHSGELFAVAGGNYGGGGDLSLWNLEEARELGFVSFGKFPFEGLAFTPDDGILAAGSNDGAVLLYAVDRLRGPQLKRQTKALCGEIRVEGDRAFIVPLSKVPTPMRRDFEYAWGLEIVGANSLMALAGSPVVLKDWIIESSADRDRARVNEFRLLLSRAPSPAVNLNYAVFGDIQNPGWNEGIVAKVYGDGSFVATNNSGQCLAYGSLNDSETTRDFDSLKKRLVGEGLIDVPREPLTIGADHYRTRFIGLTLDGVSELRSDAESIDFSQPTIRPTKKKQDFSRIFTQEEGFINSLLHAGLKLPQN